jgi:hypothetical protein
VGRQRNTSYFVKIRTLFLSTPFFVRLLPQVVAIILGLYSYLSWFVHGVSCHIGSCHAHVMGSCHAYNYMIINNKIYIHDIMT